MVLRRQRFRFRRAAGSPWATCLATASMPGWAYRSRAGTEAWRERARSIGAEVSPHVGSRAFGRHLRQRRIVDDRDGDGREAQSPIPPPWFRAVPKPTCGRSASRHSAAGPPRSANSSSGAPAPVVAKALGYHDRPPPAWSPSRRRLGPRPRPPHTVTPGTASTRNTRHLNMRALGGAGDGGGDGQAGAGGAGLGEAVEGVREEAGREAGVGACAAGTRLGRAGGAGAGPPIAARRPPGRRAGPAGGPVVGGAARRCRTAG